jgi:serine/threonine protein kinase
MGIIHNDLCPQNIRVSREGHVKIGGFHASQFFRPGDLLSRAQSESVFLSNIAYSAPELWTYNTHGFAHFNQTVDYWSLGATIFNLASGEVCFHPSILLLLTELILAGIVRRYNRRMCKGDDTADSQGPVVCLA